MFGDHQAGLQRGDFLQIGVEKIADFFFLLSLRRIGKILGDSNNLFPYTQFEEDLRQIRSQRDDPNIPLRGALIRGSLARRLDDKNEQKDQ